MTSHDPNRRGDPISRPEGVFSHVLKALFGKSEEHPRLDAPVAAGPPQPRLPAAQETRPTPAPRDEPGEEGEPASELLEELHALQPERGSQPNEADEPSPPPAEREQPRDGPAPVTTPIELHVLETLEEVGRYMGEHEPVAASVAAETPVAASVAVDTSRDREERETSGSIPLVLGELHSPSVDVRRTALERLAENPASAPVVAVAARLQDPSPEVRLAAVRVLEATHDEAVLLLLLDAMRDPSEEVRRLARDAITARGSAETTQLLHRELAVPARRWAAAKVLADLGDVDELVRAVADEDPEVRGLVREAMDEAGATEQLIEELGEDRPDRRRIAAERLGQMRVRQSVDALLERLQDPDRGVRIKAAEALGRIGEQRATHGLKKAFIWDPDSGVVVAIGNSIRKLAGTQAGRTITL